MTTALLGALTVAVATVLAIAGLLLTRRLVPLAVRESHNVATGIVYAALYVVYGVALGFSLLLVWEQFEMSRRTVEGEAVALERIHRLAEPFPEPQKGRVRDLAASYARTVAEEEWSAMGRGQASLEAARLADELGRAVRALEPASDAQAALYAESLVHLDDLRENRALRLLEVREGLPGIVWFVLVAGGVITVAFTYLFGMRSLRLHALAVGALTVVLTLVLFTIGALEYPFGGSVRVSPEAFELVLRGIS